MKCSRHFRGALCALIVLTSGCERKVPAAVVPADVISLIHAIDEGDRAKLKMLLDAGAAPTPHDSPLSPIHAAITHFQGGKVECDSEALTLLLDHKADPNFVEPDSGFSPREDALSMGDMLCAAKLKKAGANLYQHGQSGQSALQFAVKGAVRTGDTSILKLVLSLGGRSEHS